MKLITVVMAYFENPKTLRRHLEEWRRLPDWVQQQMRAIIVDDASIDSPAVQVLADADHPIPIKLYRLDEKRRWNWIASRNVAMHEASDGFHLITDIDHFVDETLARSLVCDDHNPDRVYKFARREHTGEKIKPHSNSYFMTKAMYWKIGGHDESFSGFYGSDGSHRRLVESKAKVVWLPDELIRYEYVGDSSTTVYKRKTRADSEHRQKVLAARKPGWKPKVLTFPYHEVAL